MDYAAHTARWLLGASAHPGGQTLTRHLLHRAGLAPHAVVLDLACGAGSTLALLRDAGHLPFGVDVEPRSVARARRQAPAMVADAHHLPVRSSSVDAVVCECALSTFDRPAEVLAEAARVLRPGGTFAMTDVVLHRELAPATVVASIDRLTAARTLPDYAALVEQAGLGVQAAEDRSQDAATLARRVRRRLTAVGARRTAARARECEQAVSSGVLGYGLLVARRP